jgi:adenosylcobinamide-GDP ribazoletransferase
MALAALPAAQPALLLAPTWARWLLLWVARQPLARPSGLGADFAAGLTGRNQALALLLPLLLFLPFFTLQTVLAVLAAVAATGWLIHLARQRLGGVTGDVYGLVVEVSELVILLAYTATPK